MAQRRSLLFFTPMLLSLFLVVNLSGNCKSAAQAQSLPPAKYDGFVYPTKEGEDPIIIEAFFDPVCPDSRDSWPPLKLAIQHYGPLVKFAFHLLPLPYHDNAYVTSRALHIANILNASSTYPLLEQFFTHQGKFYNLQTNDLSKVSITKEVVEFATVTVGNLFSSAIESAFNDRKTDLKTRVSFKYSTSRGVFATPTFFVNGFVLPDAGSPLDYNGWRSIIDPLIVRKSSRSTDPLHFFL